MDPDPDPSDPHVYGPAGSGSESGCISQRHGSTQKCHGSAPLDKSRVSDLNTDPDQAFFLVADPDPGFVDLKLKQIFI